VLESRKEGGAIEAGGQGIAFCARDDRVGNDKKKKRLRGTSADSKSASMERRD